MKTFLNVLYRRILYKIPLKFLLILLVIFWLLFAYTKADDIVEDLITPIDTDTITVNRYWYYTLIETNSSSDYWTYCLHVKNLVWEVNIWFYSSLSYQSALGYRLYSDWWDFYACLYTNMRYLFLYNDYTSNIEISYDLFKLNALMNTSLPIYTSQQCQTAYSLIPISSVDSSYCTSNNLCPSWWTPWDCPNVWVSNIWINDIFHPWAFNVIMNIPEEIDRDYAYTNSWQNMNIDVVWYNVDYDYIDWVVDSQNYKPNSDDLSSIVSQIIPLFVPWLCIILLLYFIFRFIKKIF